MPGREGVGGSAPEVAQEHGDLVFEHRLEPKGHGVRRRGPDRHPWARAAEARGATVVHSSSRRSAAITPPSRGGPPSLRTTRALRRRPAPRAGPAAPGEGCRHRPRPCPPRRPGVAAAIARVDEAASAVPRRSPGGHRFPPGQTPSTHILGPLPLHRAGVLRSPAATPTTGSVDVITVLSWFPVAVRPDHRSSPEASVMQRVGPAFEEANHGDGAGEPGELRHP